jgi:hypothetical protein
MVLHMRFCHQSGPGGTTHLLPESRSDVEQFMKGCSRPHGSLVDFGLRCFLITWASERP